MKLVIIAVIVMVAIGCVIAGRNVVNAYRSAVSTRVTRIERAYP